MMGALSAAAIAATIAAAVVGGTRQGPVRSSATSSTENRAVPPVALPAQHATEPARRSWSTHVETEDDVAWTDVGRDAASSSSSMPAWLDGGPWKFEDLAAFWQKEALDPEWSANIKEYIYAMLDPEDIDLDVLNLVDCRQTLCRIEMNTAHMSAIVRLSRMVSGVVSSNWPTSTLSRTADRRSWSCTRHARTSRSAYFQLKHGVRMPEPAGTDGDVVPRLCSANANLTSSPARPSKIIA
jgi:hypothetical protein